VRRTITFDDPETGHYAERQDRRAARAPRGWHLPESTCSSTASRCRCASFHALSHNAKGCWHAAPSYFYLPKIESHLEARL
jgi:hypothetical protein